MIRSRRHNLKWPKGGRIGKLTFPVGRSPTLQRGVQNENGPTSGRNSYMAPAVGEVPNPSQTRKTREIAHKLEYTLHIIRQLWLSYRFTGREEIRFGPQRGSLAT